MISDVRVRTSDVARNRTPLVLISNVENLQSEEDSRTVNVILYLHTVLHAMCMYTSNTYIQSNWLSKYLEGHTKSVLLIRGTCYQYWLT